MSRTFWIAVGAVGGVVAYRRGQRAIEDARARGLVGNVQAAAGTASAVAQGTSRLLSLAAPAGSVASREEVEADRLLRSVQVTPVRRTPLSRRDQHIPATAMRLDALNTDGVYDVRDTPINAAG